jgi:hypothetical protein
MDEQRVTDEKRMTDSQYEAYQQLCKMYDIPVSPRQRVERAASDPVEELVAAHTGTRAERRAYRSELKRAMKSGSKNNHRH